MRLGSSHHALAPPIPDHSLCGFRTRPVVTIERSSRHIVVELGSFAGGLRLNPSNTSLDSPPGLAGVFTINGGTALMITAFATRLSPWRAR